MAQPEEWTSRGLFEEINKIDQTMPDRAFAFVLGAGASVSSGIPAGFTLAKGWLEELHARCCLDGATFKDWVASGGSGISGLTMETIAQQYPKIFEKRFGRDPECGFAALEQLMDRAEPNLGYSLLAEIIDKTRHKVVITTNFDNLVADALAIHASKPPLIVGHESLAGFARPRLRRPLVAKIHRDLMLNPKNDSEGVDHLEKGWAEALKPLLQSFTPLFIGYGGNDGSLMHFLNQLPDHSLPGRPIWCKRKDTLLPNMVQEFLKNHNGIICTIAGFDEFMFPLVGTLLPEFDLSGHCSHVEDLGKSRAEKLRKQAENIQQVHTGKGGEGVEKEIRQNLADSLKNEADWWTWEMRARGEQNPEKRDAIYCEALKVLPDSADLVGNYSIFLQNVCKDHDAAEIFFKKALELDPNHARHTSNYAIFLGNVRKDYDAAEILYKKALGLDPNYANNTSNYAVFLKNVRKDYNAAEILYKKALELAPNHPAHTGNYCQFLLTKGEKTKGRELLDQAFALNPTNPALLAELWFYRLAHFAVEYPQAEQQIRNLLASGALSEGWDFRDNIARAEADGHPNVPLLRELANAISGTDIHSK